MRWIIGDVHGMLGPLEALFENIARADTQPECYFVGDYINRGPDSRRVVDLLLDTPGVHCLRGNHDDIFDQILHGAGRTENPAMGNPFAALEWFLQHGLHQTLLSYGAKSEAIMRAGHLKSGEALDEVLGYVPEAHRKFFRELPMTFETEDFFLAHGKWPMNRMITPREALKQTHDDRALCTEILWGRFTRDELFREPDWPKRGFFGHTPVQTYAGRSEMPVPIVSARRILLDTAVALSPTGRLTAWCVEEDRALQITRECTVV